MPKHIYTVTRSNGLPTETVAADFYEGSNDKFLFFTERDENFGELVAFYSNVCSVVRSDAPEKKELEELDTVVARNAQLREELEFYKTRDRVMVALIDEVEALALGHDHFGHREKGLRKIINRIFAAEPPEVPSFLSGSVSEDDET